MFVNLAPTLHSLSLRQNRLCSLPSSFGALLRLTELNLSHNRISQLPASSINLARLTYVDLSHNALTELPLVFDNMTSLRVSSTTVPYQPQMIADAVLDLAGVTC